MKRRPTPNTRNIVLLGMISGFALFGMYYVHYIEPSGDFIRGCATGILIAALLGFYSLLDLKSHLAFYLTNALGILLSIVLFLQMPCRYEDFLFRVQIVLVITTIMQLINRYFLQHRGRSLW